MEGQKQVNSKQRVTDHGEVYTAEKEVNAMLDLVKHETERIESRFLEPACGNGNFLAEILRRKLAVARRRYGKNPADYEKNAVLAATSIYGVDLLEDNVIACRERMFAIWDKEYKTVCKKGANEDCRKAVKFILARNIVCGNALSLKEVDENGNDTDKPIVFSEWAFITGFNLQRSDYTLDRLLNGTKKERDIFGKQKKRNNREIKCEQQLNLPFESEPKNKQTYIEHSNDEGVFLKKYISHYREVWKNDE